MRVLQPLIKKGFVNPNYELLIHFFIILDYDLMNFGRFGWKRFKKPSNVQNFELLYLKQMFRITYMFSPAALKSLKDLEVELDFLAKEQKYIYLFGKKVPPHPKTLLRIVNRDLASTCELCQILDNFTSHSFRIAVLSRLLCVTSLQNVADIMGNRDVRSMMKYKRYGLRKSAIQKIYTEGEQVKYN